jgi:hypothetical protein
MNKEEDWALPSARKSAPQKAMGLLKDYSLFVKKSGRL